LKPVFEKMGGTLLALAFLWPALLHADPTGDEKSSLQAAERFYQEGAFDLASDRVAALLKKYPKTELLAAAELVQAQALYQLGRSDDAYAALTLPVDQVPEDLRSDTVFWQAEALLDLGRWNEAEQKYRALLGLKNTPERNDAANLGLAWALFKEGRQADAMPLIQALTKESPNGPAGQQAQLLLAKIQMAQGQLPQAIASLEALLATKPAPGLAFNVDYWLGDAYAATGDYTKAANAYQDVTGPLPTNGEAFVPSGAFPKTLVAQAFLGLGRAEHALHQEDQATLAYGQAYTLTENGAAQMEAFHAYLDNARAARQLPEAVAKLQEFAKTSPPSAPAALLAIGTALAADGEDDKAIGILESLLVAYSKSDWIPAANYQLGMLYARTGKTAQATRALQSCLDAKPDDALARSARFELGTVLSNQAHDNAGAAAQFAQLSTGTDAIAEGAAYNFLLAQAALGKSDAFVKAEADFEKRFPKSNYLKKIALAQGQLLAENAKPDDAKDSYQRGLTLPGDGLDQRALLEALADLQYQTGDLAGTVKTCREIVAEFPDDALLAEQRAILVSHEMKTITDDQAEQQLLALAQKYVKSPDAPEAYFRLGEFYDYRQDYVKEQDAFQQLTTTYPNSPFAADAYFFAGRAAAAHMDYTAAQGLLEKVPDDSHFKSDAQLWEARVYQQQLNFIQATTLADQILATEKSGPHFVAANLLKGHCLFAMAEKNPADYSQALAAFDQILKGQEGTPSERNEAAVSSAKCLEKMGRTDDAMALYLNVLYGTTPAVGAVPAPSDFSWQIEAGWSAGRIREAQKDWRGAIEIYRRLEQIGGPHQQEFHDLVNKLRRDNYIYE
jgi:tetratricopeptide (TPR) repeat protein